MRLDCQLIFSSQTKAVGKTWHKACLRCAECNKSLDSGRLNDHDGDPHCQSCYGKVDELFFCDGCSPLSSCMALIKDDVSRHCTITDCWLN